MVGGAGGGVCLGVEEEGGAHEKAAGKGGKGEAAKVVGEAEGDGLGVGGREGEGREGAAWIGDRGRWQVAKEVGEFGGRAEAEGENDGP